MFDRDQATALAAVLLLMLFVLALGWLGLQERRRAGTHPQRRRGHRLRPVPS